MAASRGGIGNDGRHATSRNSGITRHSAPGVEFTEAERDKTEAHVAGTHAAYQYCLTPLVHTYTIAPPK
jgi:hypothetical protein